MRVACAAGAGISVVDIPEPVPGPGQVLAAPLACGICGSDLHLAEALQKRRDDVAPVMLGHEFCAEIIGHGPQTRRLLPVGSRVVSMPLLAADNGFEPLGLSTRVPGGFADRMLLDEDLLLPLPDNVETRYGALVEPLAVGVRAVNAADLAGGDVSLVLGCGPVGSAVVAMLKVAGHRVVAADMSPRRRALAAALGADAVVDPRQESPYARWRALGALDLPYSPALTPDVVRSNAVVFECVGKPGMLQQIIDEAPGHARVVCVGVCMRADIIRPDIAIAKELSISFVFAYRPEEFRQALEMIADGTLDPSPFVSGTVPLDDIADAFDQLRNPDEHLKLVVCPG